MYQHKHIESRIHKSISKYLVNNGFIANNFNEYLCNKREYFDEITFRVAKIGLNFGVFYFVSRSYGKIEKKWSDLIRQFNLNDTITTISLSRTKLNPQLEDTKGFPILKGGGVYLGGEDIDQEVLRFRELFVNEYENLILPQLKLTEDIHWLNRILNSDPMDFEGPSKYVPHNGMVYKKLIVAKLSGNVEFEKIYKMFIKILDDFIKQTNDDNTKKELLVLNIIYERLKNIEPLNNPILV